MSAPVCPECGKQCYPSKTAAKKTARALYPGRRMEVYRCRGWWHLASPAEAGVVRDQATR